MALTDKLTNIANAIREKTGSTRTMNLEGMAAAVTNIKIPTALSDLNEDETHRTVTDAEKKTWNNKSNFSGNYDDLQNKPTIPTIPEKLPNPNALTFTGAVEGSYDGSAPLTVEIPSGGGGGETGAKEFRLIRSITLGEQSDRVDISVDSNGNAFALHEVYVMLSAQSYEDAYHEVSFLPNGLWGAGDAYITSANKASKSSETWKNDMIFHSVYADGVICSEQLPTRGQNNGLTSSFATGQSIITKISLACKFAAGCTFLVMGR